MVETGNTDHSISEQLQNDCSLKEEQIPTLYGSYIDEASWRVRIALEWKGIDYKQESIDIDHGEHLSSRFYKLNPCKKLPCYMTRTGKILTQSLAIIEYLELNYPQRPMWPKAIYHRAKAIAITQDICDIQTSEIKKYLNMIDMDPNQRQETIRRVIEGALAGLEKKIKCSSGTYCIGDHISVADFFLVPLHFTVTKKFGIDMKQFPYITRIRNTLMTLSEFKNTHPYNQPDCPEELRGSEL
ncbi:thioredoxin-like protein [Rhizopus microsporus var. microsporus]|uniref:Thioredoxin-like protein n=2 Tax=Rhizopus microsporus TaxID=58291 RepID=A0A2G4SVH7_RHIZD|nr:thioredoxin-like protein [Rhizopus microsporus ATCC 52813]ORE07674.1 thioredoxin-like protein [Rhizopus microsporus var. microsporus]PHZ12781.1 thioredoxin-like protein [Rhizopus microsporus ATCC 52813]